NLTFVKVDKIFVHAKFFSIIPITPFLAFHFCMFFLSQSSLIICPVLFCIFRISFASCILARKQDDTYISTSYVLNYYCPSLDLPPSMARFDGRDTNLIFPCRAAVSL